MPANSAIVAVTLIAPALDSASDSAPVPSAPDSDPNRSIDRLGERCGGRFERQPITPRPWESRLMERLGLVDAERVPAARLLATADLAGVDGGGGASSDVVVADPVSLAAGRDEAVLTPPEALRLDPDEVESLFTAANELLAEDAARFERGASGRWYLRGLDARALDTPPTHFLAHREAGGSLPGAGAAAPWRRLMAELEMLWHAHPSNAARAGRGLPPVNGVWFWGGAPLPPARETPPAVTLLADDPLALALGRHAGVDVRASPDDRSFDALLRAAAEHHGDARGRPTDDDPPSLVIVDQSAHAAWLANDADALEAARQRLVERWLAPAAAAVRDGRAVSLALVSDDGRQTRYAPPMRRSRFARLFGRR